MATTKATKTTSKAQPQQGRDAGGYGKSQFKPVDYDASEIMPDAEPGKYGGKVADVKVKPHKETKYPMLIVEFELESAEDADNEKYIGGTVSRFINIYPDNDRRGNFGKQALEQFEEATGVPRKLIPRRINSAKDFKAWIEAAKGKHMPLWISNREANNQNYLNVDFVDPEGSSDPGYEVEEEEAPEPASERQPARRSGGRRGR